MRLKNLIINKVNVLLLGQLFFYALLLLLDLKLVNWYQDFYSAVNKKSLDEFEIQVLVFVGIVTLQALLMAIISFNTDIYEIRIKQLLVNTWLAINDRRLHESHTTSKIDQRIIDDAAFAAEKLSGIIPSLIFNLCKSLIFLYLLSNYPVNTENWIVVKNIWDGQYGLCFFGILYFLIQFNIVQKSSKWVGKSENIKRKAEATVRYVLVNEGTNSTQKLNSINKYLGRIINLRYIIGKAHGSNVFLLNAISSMSIIVPFVIIFDFYVRGQIDFGQVMKITATYSGFQGSALFVFTFYKDFFRGLSAFKRILS
jgi:ABC-type uncharacterized transport system fused permease/ATPase subunit